MKKIIKSCSDCQKNISAYIDKMLSKDKMIAMHEHIEKCSKCKKEYLMLSNIIGACEKNIEEDLPENFTLNLHERLEKESIAIQADAKKEINNNKINYKKSFSVLAASIVVLFSFWLFTNNPLTNKKSADIADIMDFDAKSESSSFGTKNIKAKNEAKEEASEIEITGAPQAEGQMEKRVLLDEGENNDNVAMNFSESLERKENAKGEDTSNDMKLDVVYTFDTDNIKIYSLSDIGINMAEFGFTEPFLALPDVPLEKVKFGGLVEAEQEDIDSFINDNMFEFLSHPELSSRQSYGTLSEEDSAKIGVKGGFFVRIRNDRIIDAVSTLNELLNGSIPIENIQTETGEEETVIIFFNK